MGRRRRSILNNKLCKKVCVADWPCLGPAVYRWKPVSILAACLIRRMSDPAADAADSDVDGTNLTVQAAMVHPVPASLVPVMHAHVGRTLLAVGDRDGPQLDGSNPGKTFEREVSVDMVLGLLEKLGCAAVVAWWSTLTEQHYRWLRALQKRDVAIVLIGAGHGAAGSALRKIIVTSPSKTPTKWYVVAIHGTGHGAGSAWQHVDGAPLQASPVWKAWPKTWQMNGYGGLTQKVLRWRRARRPLL